MTTAKRREVGNLLIRVARRREGLVAEAGGRFLGGRRQRRVRHTREVLARSCDDHIYSYRYKTSILNAQYMYGYE